jgi:hypothetical protein
MNDAPGIEAGGKTQATPAAMQPGLAILGAGGVLGIMGDSLLRATPWGLNAMLCTTGVVTAAGWVAHRRGLALSHEAPWLALMAVVLSSNFVARDSAALRACNVLGIAIVLSLGHFSLRGVALRGRDAWEYLHGAIVTMACAGLGVWPLVAREIRWDELPRGGALARARGAALGTLLALPLLLVFGGLFASADPIFHDVAASVLDVDVAVVVSHTFLVAGGAALAAGYLWGSVLRRSAPPGFLGGELLSLGITPVATALALLDGLFLMFVVIQLRYLFGGALLIQGTTELTYAEYARRGFFELVAASALVLPILLCGDWVLRDASCPARRLFRCLAALLLALLAVVMASALRRVWLYVDEFGLSEIRLYATAFMVYLASLSAWFAWTVLRDARRRFAFGALVQGFAVLGGLHLLNPDALIVRTNLARPAHARPFDARYAASLSADAVPDLLAALPRLAASEQCRVAGRLLARWAPGATGGGDDDWRNWNLARARARRAVREHETSLRALTCTESPP